MSLDESKFLSSFMHRKEREEKESLRERLRGRSVIRSQPAHPCRQILPGQDLSAQKNDGRLVGNFYPPVMRFLFVFLMGFNNDPVLN